MSCCSNKRKILAQKLKNEKKTSVTHTIEKQITSKFIYAGKGSWRYRGTSSGTWYHFKFPGHIIEVDPVDASAALAEPLLQSVQ